MAWSPGAGRDDKGYQSNHPSNKSSIGNSLHGGPTYKAPTTLTTPDGGPIPKKKPTKTKVNTVNEGFIKNYFNNNPYVKIGNKISKSKFNTNINAKKREKYINDLLETNPDEYNRIMGQLSKVNMIVGPKVIGGTQLGPQVTTDYGMPSAPPSMLTSNFEEIDGRKSLGDDAALEILGQKYKDTLNPLQAAGGGNPYILPEYAMMGGGADLGGEDVEEEEKTFDYRFGDPNENVAEDVRLGRYKNFAANGGIMGLRARKAFGGIMDRVTGRRAYGLGSIFKKVTRAAKKVLSSDVGKMAIAGAAIYYGGGGGNPFTAAGRGKFSWGLGGTEAGKGFFSKGNPLLFSANDKGVQKFNPWKLAAMTVGAGALMGPAKVDQLPGSENRGGSLIDPITGQPAKPAEMRASLNNALENAGGDPIRIKQINDAYAFLGPDERLGTYLPYQTYGVKDGGRIGYDVGGPAEIGEKNISDVLARVKELEDEGLDFGAAMSQAMRELSEGKAQGGRIGFDYGSSYQKNYLINKGYGDQLANMKPKEITQLYDSVKGTWTDTKAQGGRIGKAEGGLMDLGGMEKDYRAEGGFVPIGAKEKADDVPARLSVNEFVFTADAVRNAGGGDIDQGAEVMENVMKNLEAGGKISAETQGNTGAQEMFSVSERLGEVI